MKFRLYQDKYYRRENMYIYTLDPSLIIASACESSMGLFDLSTFISKDLTGQLASPPVTVSWEMNCSPEVYSFIRKVSWTSWGLIRAPAAATNRVWMLCQCRKLITRIGRLSNYFKVPFYPMVNPEPIWSTLPFELTVEHFYWSNPNQSNFAIYLTEIVKNHCNIR